jgi:hypothetical protein
LLGPDGLSRFEELSRQEAADTAILYAFDLIEHDGEDMRNRPFLDRKAALARLLRNTRLASYSTNTSSRTAPSCWRTPAGLAPRASCRRRSIDLSIRSMSGLNQVRNPTSIAVQRERGDNWNRRGIPSPSKAALARLLRGGECRRVSDTGGSVWLRSGFAPPWRRITHQFEAAFGIVLVCQV